MESSTEYRQVLRVSQSSARSSNRKGTPKKKRSSCEVADAFLKERFQPYVPSSIATHYREKETAFFTSLKNVCDLYHIRLSNYSDYYYPQNILYAYTDTLARLRSIDKDLELAIISNDNTDISLAVYKEWHSSDTLLYISVRPLCSLFRNEKRKDLSALLLSVFSYLYNVLKIPYYTRQSSYLFWNYENLREYWLEDEECDKKYISEIRNAYRIGNKIFKKIRQPKHLSDFGKRLRRFKPQGNFEVAVKECATVLYRLYRKYPHRSILNNLNTELLDQRKEYTTYLEQYVSFNWDNDVECIMNHLIESVNIETQESEQMELPCTIQLFDKPQKKITIDLSFENEVMHQIDELIYLLSFIV